MCPSEPTPSKDEGWFGPSGSRRFHYFDSDLRSLCGKWTLWKHPEAVGLSWDIAQDFTTGGDCAECSRRLAKREEAKQSA